MTPADYARSYATMQTWFWDGSDWLIKRAPIVNYLQHNASEQDKRAAAAEAKLRRLLPAGTGQANVNQVKTFNFDNYDYINNSISRCFIGKACPWEIQETLQLASQIGAIVEESLYDYCTTALGVDCGGFVANYWGESCPHMTQVAPVGWSGILPRTFWSSTQLWPDIMSRRRQSASQITAGDAAIFFKDVKDNNPDIAKQRDGNGKLIAGTGSEAFHIGVVNQVGYGGEAITKLEVAESSGAKSIYGGSGVNVRAAGVTGSGKSGKWIYAEVGSNERIYFVAPPWGWGPETGYNLGEI